MVQWLGLCALTAEGLGSIPDWGTKIPQAANGAAKKKMMVRQGFQPIPPYDLKQEAVLPLGSLH